MGKIKEYFSLSTYLIFHPADGFYQMKHEKQGRVGIIFLNLLLFWISFSFKKQYTGFALNDVNPKSFNIFLDLAMVTAAFVLWCVGSWSITTLMDGEGSIKDIAMATAYSATPVILLFIPATIVSRFMVYNEKEIFTLVIGIAIVWSVLLLFMGILSVQNYTLGKTLITVVLTFIAILIILFLVGLMSSLMQQIYVFFESIYTEIIYRA